MYQREESQPFGYNDNLPDLIDEFVNRERAIEIIESYLFDRQFRHLSIWGEAGVGKTTLAIKFTHLLRNYHIFDSIIWMTAKEIELEVTGGRFRRGNVSKVRKKTERKRQGVFVKSLEDIYRTILRVSMFPDYDYSLEWDNDQLYETVLAWLKARRIMVIIDDLDSWKDWRFLLRFAERIPFPSVVLLTTRRKLTSDNVAGLAPLSLGPLSYLDAKKLLQLKMYETGTSLDPDDQEELLRFSEGNPLIINLSFGLIIQRTKRFFFGGQKITVSEIVSSISQNTSVVDYLFEDLYLHLTNQAQNILLNIAVLFTIFPEPTLEQIERLSYLRGDQLHKPLKELQSVSLINRVPDDENLVDMHDLTYQFVMNVAPEKTREIQARAEEIFGD